MVGEYHKLSQLQKQQLDGERLHNKQMEAQKEEMIGLVQYNLNKIMEKINQEDQINVLIVEKKGTCLESVPSLKKKGHLESQ